MQNKICPKCGQEFTPRNAAQKYCRQLKQTSCVICGRPIEYICGEYVAKACDAQACVTAYQQQAFAEKHNGAKNPMQLPESIEKIKATNIKKYGSEWYTRTSEYREKTNQTNLEKYGTEWYLGSSDSMVKRTATNLQKYGVDNVFKSGEIKDRIKQVFIDRYGVEYVSQAQEIKDKTVQSNIEKYGVKHPMMLKEYQQKAIDTNIRLYGRAAYTQQHIKNIEAWYQFIDDPAKFIIEHYLTPPRTAELAADLGVDLTTVDVYLDKHSAKGSVRRAKSLMEEDVIALIRKIYPECQIIENDKTLIRPFELDLYLPEYKFAIECNPTCTHNSSSPDPWGGEPKLPSYHKQKTDACEAVGVRLLHIFGYDWEYHRDVIESMILNAVNKPAKVIYARKCKLVNVSGADAMKFLNENHRQGATNSPINLGLEYEGELVSLMTFGKMRGTIGTGKEDLTDCYELVRFCSLLNTSVVGGASKLLKHFVNEYEPKRIRSFSDRAHTSGKLYQVLGFEEVRRSDPGYVWVDVYNDRAYHRVNAQKANIRKFLKDDSIDLSLTEREIMEGHGFVRVYDSGTITWEWRKECCAHET